MSGIENGFSQKVSSLPRAESQPTARDTAVRENVRFDARGLPQVALAHVMSVAANLVASIRPYRSESVDAHQQKQLKRKRQQTQAQESQASPMRGLSAGSAYSSAELLALRLKQLRTDVLPKHLPGRMGKNIDDYAIDRFGDRYLISRSGEYSVVKDGDAVSFNDRPSSTEELSFYARGARSESETVPNSGGTHQASSLAWCGQMADADFNKQRFLSTMGFRTPELAAFLYEALGRPDLDLTAGQYLVDPFPDAVRKYIDLQVSESALKQLLTAFHFKAE